ncbi:hypothetical protein TorRG33x02_227480, partial [Trema orientale]
ESLSKLLTVHHRSRHCNSSKVFGTEFFSMSRAIFPSRSRLRASLSPSHQNFHCRR